MAIAKPRRNYGFVPIRQRIANASFTGYSGAMDVSDRGFGNYIPLLNDNPYSSQDYLYRWRQYVAMYEMSWEARKIIRIIPEDALRKEWETKGIPEDAASAMKARLDQLQFLVALKRSLILERLLGGSLTFMGIDSQKDDPEIEYRPREGQRIRFFNAIALSRISRVEWCNDPLSEHYLRPNSYMINGKTVHVSRCLVWDGEPLFDPNDFALNNFRPNIAGFGPSKLAPIWDDIVKAVGTRQAAYQLIQTNNAIIAAISDLQDLMGTTSGKKTVQRIKDIANQLSLYRAAIIDGEKVEIGQHSASFGSVPELLITYLQVLAAASDIPATRFLGQAPGGLNATGESDLENYYNTIDAYQRQKIEPQLRRVYDILGYNMFPSWHQMRNNLEFEFPPLWNESELEQATRAQITIANVVQLLEQRIITEEQAIEELNLKDILSVTLDAEDLALMDDMGDGESALSPEPAQDQPTNQEMLST